MSQRQVALVSPSISRRPFQNCVVPPFRRNFSHSDGDDLHCEPQGTGIRDLRVFNGLDETLK